jgi:RND superfamily putative drug exporter
VALVVLGFLTSLGYLTGDDLFSRLTSGQPVVPGESTEGRDLLYATSTAGPSIHLLVDDVRPDDPTLHSLVTSTRNTVSGVDGVDTVLDPYLATDAGGVPTDTDAGGVPTDTDAGGVPTDTDAGGVPTDTDAAGAPGAGPDLAALSAGQVARDGRAVLVTVLLRSDLPTARSEQVTAAVTNRLTATGDEVERSVPGATARVGAQRALFDEVTGQVREDLETGEMIALPVSLLFMILIFGGFLAAGLPLLGAVSSVAGGLATLLGFSYLIDLDASVVNVVTLLSLGLCIDYSLLIVSRYREELRRLLAPAPDRRPVPVGVSSGPVPVGVPGASTSTPTPDAGPGPRSGTAPDGSRPVTRPPDRAVFAEAMAVTLDTAGRTILFSAVTVGISLSGLFLFSSDFLQAVGAAGVSVVVVALLVALTLVPALLAMSGTRVVRPGVTHRIPGVRRVARRLGDVAPEEGAFSRLARGVQRHPVLVLVGGLTLLVVGAAPLLRLNLVSSAQELLPASSEQRQVFDALEERFPAVSQAPVVVVSRAPLAEVGRWAGTVRELPGVASVDPPRVQGDPRVGQVVVLGVRPAGDEASDVARQVVREIREVRPDFPVWVTGSSALLEDFVAAFGSEGLRAATVVVLTTFLLLFLMTGSVLIPLKALVMNVCSLGAALGVMVWIFQDGHLEDLLGYTSVGAVETSIPALALTFGFGLAMDYEVFLLARIKEFHDAGMGNDESVVRGLQRSGRIITSAALIMVVVFLGFVAGELLVIKQIGVVLAVAVAVDATLVRMLLVPATMTLLGNWNWWAPGPLRRLHARIGLRHD